MGGYYYIKGVVSLYCSLSLIESFKFVGQLTSNPN